MKNTLLFTYCINILVRLLTVNKEELSYPQKSENLRPRSSTSIENATKLESIQSWKCDPSGGTSPLASYKESALCRSASPALSFLLFYTDVWLQHLFNWRSGKMNQSVIFTCCVDLCIQKVLSLIPLPFLAFFRHIHKTVPNVIEFLPVAPSWKSHFPLVTFLVTVPE